MSKAACIEGQTWGVDGNGIWVSNGCRAEFWIDDIPNYDPSWMHGGGSSSGGSSGGSYGNTIRCESQGRGHHYCPAYTGNGVHLVRQLSRSECVYQRSWGYDSGGIWVSDGCRAEFSTDGGSRNGGWSGGNQGTTVRCESQGGNRNYCRADTRGGVSLLRQMSRAACIQGRSWGFDGGGIWVDEGCRGEFQLGYRGHDGGGNQKHHGNNTAAVAAGALILGALVAVAATSGSKKKQEQAASTQPSGETGTVSSSGATEVSDRRPGREEGSTRADIACRAAVQQKILDHYGEEAVVRFATTSVPAPSGSGSQVGGTGTVEFNGRSWNISYTCLMDDATGKVVEAHVLE